MRPRVALTNKPEGEQRYGILCERGLQCANRRNLHLLRRQIGPRAKYVVITEADKNRGTPRVISHVECAKADHGG
jgi:hypothetical protein